VKAQYTLEPIDGSGEPLEFEWDPATGELAGRDAHAVRGWAEQAQRNGYATGHPHPTRYVAKDPLRSRSEMAVILGNVWWLSPDLMDAYPQPVEEHLAS
jgi:hypothetical protein